MTNKIVRSAILWNGIVHTGPRHGSIIRRLVAEGYSTPIRGKQGFVLENGEFIDRTAGAKIAIESGQIEKLKWPPYLYSEDLWQGNIEEEHWSTEELHALRDKAIEQHGIIDYDFADEGYGSKEPFIIDDRLWTQEEIDAAKIEAERIGRLIEWRNWDEKD